MWEALSNVLRNFRRNRSSSNVGTGSINDHDNCNLSRSTFYAVSTDVRLKDMLSVPLPLPEDAIIVILSYVSANDLFQNCIYIKEWHDLIKGQSLWLRKCENEGITIPHTKPQPLPEHFYRALYFVPFGRNLVKNPCGKDNLSHWQIETRNEYSTNDNGWAIENPPHGADPVPNSECQSCFATTYTWCVKSQRIDLLEAVGGFTLILDELKPQIEVSEWYAARFDCGSIYQLYVCLLNDKEEVVDKFEFNHTEPQWTGNRWEQVKHVFENYPSGVRYVQFSHSGKDTQFWAGHYGSKMTNARVSFLSEH